MRNKANTSTTYASRLRWALVGVLLGVSATAHTSETDWMLAQDEDRVQVYTRSAPDSPFLEVKATALINAPIAQVAEAVGDGDGCDEWRSMCKSSEVLRTLSDNEQLVYLVLDMPWPLTDRDMVIHSTADIDVAAKIVRVELESASLEHPEQHYVRAISNGSYQIEALTEHQVEFTYILHTDLGGDLSANMINRRLIASTYKDVKRLQDLAEK